MYFVKKIFRRFISGCNRSDSRSFISMLARQETNINKSSCSIRLAHNKKNNTDKVLRTYCIIWSCCAKKMLITSHNFVLYSYALAQVNPCLANVVLRYRKVPSRVLNVINSWCMTLSILAEGLDLIKDAKIFLIVKLILYKIICNKN